MCTKILHLCVLSFLINISWAKTVVISDIDDTIKMTNNMSSTGTIVHFLDNDPFPVMPILFRELKSQLDDKGEQVEFHYVSGGYRAIFNGDKFIKKNNFPSGKVYLRNLKSPRSTFTYKYLTITKIIEDLDPEDRQNLTVYFFGDNAAYDADVYWQLTRDLTLKSHIFIRDVQTKATFALEGESLEQAKGLHYFFTERDLKKSAVEPLLGKASHEKIEVLNKAKKLLPEYVKRTLKSRISKKNNCIDQDNLADVIKCNKKAKKEAARLIDEYFAHD
ncbi:MAG: DUF2183 domain-containing protein [Bdellovibrio sp.]|nr:DUF2183 domain-containing protein [Bdellovibrio sp.]